MREWNERIELEARTKINFSVYIIAIPFMIRSIYALLRIFAEIDRPIDNSIQIDGWYAPIISLVYILIADITPITSQLTSMLIIEVENRIDRDSSSINYYSSGDNDIVLNKNIHPILIKSSPKSQTFDFNRRYCL